MEDSRSFCHDFHFESGLPIHNKRLICMVHDVPVIPKERNVIMDHQLIEVLTSRDDLSIVILCTFVFETTYLAVISNFKNVITIFDLNLVFLFMDRES